MYVPAGNVLDVMNVVYEVELVPTEVAVLLKW
jgi:hypothetical protein